MNPSEKLAFARDYRYLSVKVPREHVALVVLDRAGKLNTMDDGFFREFHDCFTQLGDDPEVRAVVLASASDTVFTAGLDLKAVMAGMVPSPSNSNDPAEEGPDVARTGLYLMSLIDRWQRAFTAMETCRVPVIAAVHGACVGGGIDLITAADIRVCSPATTFSVKEVDLSMAADLGTLQRLPKIVGNQSLVREWCYTGRTVTAAEALAAGLVSHVVPVSKDGGVSPREAVLGHALKLAATIARKSPVATVGIKRTLVYARDHTVDDGLQQVAMWNSSQIQARDLMASAAAILGKTTPKFPKL
ncbi:hypothetical protein H9P43_001294 [Blastocladiella emersonii ATCC 22665]|nr:hypothetical protein H9P43_001288 [Blastocladiella emersonii ATCC 22665]KAI9189861.1 hypothetical protein H9P43_001294 [Blastocladiella emersonii ATCC 22665]